MNPNRTQRLAAGRRLLAGMLAQALAASGVLALSATGATFHGVSAWWQLVLLLAGLSLTGLALAVRPRERFMAQANLLGRASPVGRRVADAAAVATALGLTFLFLAPEWRADAPPARPPVLVFRQESFTGPGAGPRLTVVGDLAGSVTVESNWVVDSAPDPTTSVWRPVAPAQRGETVWVKVDGSRWPLSIPATGVPVSATSPAFAPRWVGRVDGARAAQPGEPVYPLEWLTPLHAPPPQFPPADVPPRKLSEAGLKPGGPEAAAPGGETLRLYQWAMLPVPKYEPALVPPPWGPSADAFGTVFRTWEPPVVSPASPASVTPLVPLLGVSYDANEGASYLTRVSFPDLSGVDPLGESELRQGARHVDEAVRRWRSRRYASGTAVALPADATPPRLSAGHRVAVDRYAPAPARAGERAANLPEFPPGYPFVAVVAAGFLVLLLKPRWR